MRKFHTFNKVMTRDYYYIHREKYFKVVQERIEGYSERFNHKFDELGEEFGKGNASNGEKLKEWDQLLWLYVSNAAFVLFYNKALLNEYFKQSPKNLAEAIQCVENSFKSSLRYTKKENEQLRRKIDSCREETEISLFYEKLTELCMIMGNLLHYRELDKEKKQIKQFFFISGWQERPKFKIDIPDESVDVDTGEMESSFKIMYNICKGSLVNLKKVEYPKMEEARDDLLVTKLHHLQYHEENKPILCAIYDILETVYDRMESKDFEGKYYKDAVKSVLDVIVDKEVVGERDIEKHKPGKLAYKRCFAQMKLRELREKPKS